jgi:hypothetical protein
MRTAYPAAFIVQFNYSPGDYLFMKKRTGAVLSQMAASQRRSGQKQ